MASPSPSPARSRPPPVRSGVATFAGGRNRRLSALDVEMIAESIPHIVWTARADGTTAYLNRRGRLYTGRPRQTGGGWDWAGPTSNVESSLPSAEDPDHVHHLLSSYYPVRIGDEVIGVGNLVLDITERKVMEETIARNLAAMVDTIATTVELRDPYTAGHQRRVAELAGAIGKDLGLRPAEIEGIRAAASIHDIGKISVPAEILSKPGRLSAAELALIREHAEAGYEIVAGIDFPWPVAEMIRQHHERIDGSGYPKGLKGDEILPGARIIAVADVVEAMTAHRPYRPGLGIEKAIEHAKGAAGVTLDAAAVEACCRVLASGQITLRVPAGERASA